MEPPNKAYVRAVLDGRTFLTQQGTQIRLARVQTPEEGMPMAELARQHLKKLIHKQWVDLKPIGREGNALLCEVWAGDRSINDAIAALL